MAEHNLAKVFHKTSPWRKLLIENGHRRLAVFSGERGWANQQAHRVWRDELGAKVCLGDATADGIKGTPFSKASGFLGQEFDLVIFDAWSGFDPDAFGAISGTIRAGGVLLMLAPELDSWADQADPELNKLCVHPWQPNQLTNRLVKRLSRLIRQDTEVLLVTPAKVRLGSSEARRSPVEYRNSRVAWRVAANEECLSEDQAAAVSAIERVVTGHRRRPVVLVADRGRGKSAALGIAAARLLLQGKERILVTAPRLSSVASLFSQAVAKLGETECKLSGGVLEFEAGVMQFIAPDELLRSAPGCDLLLVDEAAGIPLHLLEKMVRRYARVAFATTVHGYEGSGRGFSVRFESRLDIETPGWKRVLLKTPIRYAKNDPLERFVFQSLLLDAGDINLAAGEQLGLREVECVRLDRDVLTQDELLLKQVFGLLVLSHYKTRPFDLRNLLDGPNIGVWVARVQGRVLATALVAREGGISEDLTEEIFLGRRRLHGHLLAQSLSANLGQVKAPCQLGDRVMRIAVEPSCRGRGIGSQLLNEVRTTAAAENCDWFGSSFGATPGLLVFWARNGFTPVHLGSMRDAYSGSHSVIVIQGLSPRGQTMVRACREAFAVQFPHLLADVYSDLEVDLVSDLLVNQHWESRLSGEELRLLKGFAEWNRPYENSVYLLWRFALEMFSAGSSHGILDEAEKATLVTKVLQKKSWRTVSEIVGLNGRDEVLTLLRKATSSLLASIPGEPRPLVETDQ